MSGTPCVDGGLVRTRQCASTSPSGVNSLNHPLADGCFTPFPNRLRTGIFHFDHCYNHRCKIDTRIFGRILAQVKYFISKPSDRISYDGQARLFDPGIDDLCPDRVILHPPLHSSTRTDTKEIES